MILYLEEQLIKAYRAYVTHIPLGSTIPDIEFFRKMIEEEDNADFFEELLYEWETLRSQRETH
jgi:hypothetical protein|tara:strand:- start:426 stop:614 length:189 start_codon:yes stop_codon:yes gene_type:complete